MSPDLINGVFEMLGGASIWMHVKTILRDRQSRGVNPYATTFFTLWGFWNLFYYPNLAQWWSFTGGLVIVVGNAFWLFFQWRFRKS